MAASPLARFDHSAALTLLSQGKSLTEVGCAFGVSGERIRQIARKHSVQYRTAHDAIALRDARIMERLSAGEVDETIAASLGVSVQTVGSARRRAGVSIIDFRASQYEGALRLIQAGHSIRQVAMSAGIDAQTLAKYASKAGVKSKNGRWRDLSHRGPAICSMREAGRSWSEVAFELSLIEKRTLGAASIAKWAKRKLPNLARWHGKRVAK